jgi:trehalose synthase
VPPIEHVHIAPLSYDRFQSVLDPDAWQALQGVVAEAQELLAGRVVWNVNSTATGGGVAEMLNSLLAYSRGAGVDTRWVVIQGNPAFFEVTKRIHNHLHGAPGDGGALGERERKIYTDALAENAAELAELVRPQDIVLLHDPQTAGLIPALRDIGAKLVWRAHIGMDTPNEFARGAWDFLRPFVIQADEYVFSRQAFAWEGLDRDKISIIAPSIDAFSPKNQTLDDRIVTAILQTAGLLDGAPAVTPTFTREDGTPARVDRTATISEVAKVPHDAQVVVQVSRWDRLKDPIGVIEGFADHVVPHTENAHLVYAGPAVEAVSDDPEGAEVLRESQDTWASLPDAARHRVHLACLPMDDTEENAVIVNALQRRADVVVQKSLAEGFGLTVSEGMWKGRPVVASRIGGIQDQIIDGETGTLIDDPYDLAAYGRAVTELLNNPTRAERIGKAAAERVREEFLGPRHLTQYVRMFARLISQG